MSMKIYCDKCSAEINSIDSTLLIQFDTVTAWCLTNLNHNASQMLESGDNVILCEKCTDKFYKFIKYEDGDGE